MTKPPKLPTRVGRAAVGENHFFGASVERELLGNETFASMTWMAVVGRRIPKEDAPVLDAIAVVVTSADPRIWLYKTVRVASSYGGMAAGLVSGNLCLYGANVGHLTASEAARVLVDLRERLGASIDDPGAVDRVVTERLEAGDRITGYGVPFRPYDERAVALREHLAAQGRDRGPYWKLQDRVAEVMRRRRGLEMNLGGALSPVLLDIGIDLDAISPLVLALGEHSFFANAVEGARQAPALLQELPEEAVHYVGAPPRRTPRSGG